MDNILIYTFILAGVWAYLIIYALILGRENDKLLGECQNLMNNLIKEHIELLEMKNQHQQIILELQKDDK